MNNRGTRKIFRNMIEIKDWPQKWMKYFYLILLLSDAYRPWAVLLFLIKKTNYIYILKSLKKPPFFM